MHNLGGVLGNCNNDGDEMTSRDYFLQMMRERRQYMRGSAEYEWRTKAARKYVWIMRDIPVSEWKDMT